MAMHHRLMDQGVTNTCLGRDIALTPRSIRPARSVRLCASAHSEELRTLKYKDEYHFNLSEYMVVLDKPLGLTLAPDPIRGQIMVQSIKDGSLAANSQLIQVGDIVRKCSAVFGEDMWNAVDIRRMRWAINNRTSKVKLVLQRVRRPLASPPVWYNQGQMGNASVERDVLQLPVSFVTATLEDDWSQDMVAPGRPMFVGFHRSVVGSAQLPHCCSMAARQARLQHLREELVQSSSSKALELDSEAARNSAVAGQQFLSSMIPGRTSAESSPLSHKKVQAFLQWLLIATARMDTRELTMLASARGLGSMLELSLALSPAGFLSVKGQEVMPPHEVNAPSWSGEGDETGSSHPGAGHQMPVNNTQACVGHALSRTSISSQDPRETEIRMLLHAAACLQRLSFRRLGSFFHHSIKERCAILLHCEAGARAKIADLLAGWLHWYCHMPLQEAILSAELSTGLTVNQSLLDAATELLVRWADERLNQVVLTWKYGALSVAVSGDIVGGWNHRVPLTRCSNPHGCKGWTSRGHFYLPLTGLKPGTYYFKFIVDGTWTVDPAAPKVIDTSGNYNNVLEVFARPPCVTSKERLQLARLQAAQLALDSKMMPHMQA